MLANFQTRFIILLTLAGFMIIDVPQVDAQGILQRLGTRIRSRIPGPPPPVIPPSRSTAPPGARVPRYQVNRPAETGDEEPAGNRSLGNRLSPISPNERQREGGAGPSVLMPEDRAEVARAGNLDGDRSVTMGLRVANPRPGFPAVQVVSFDEGSLAREAGIQVGDSILAVEGVPTPDIASIAAQLSNRRPGENVELYLDRRGRLMRASVELISTRAAEGFPTDPPKMDPIDRNDFGQGSQSGEPELRQGDLAPSPRLGIEVESQADERGAVIVSVEPDSPAARSGLRLGDRIVAVDNRFVANPDRLAEVLGLREAPMAAMAVKLVRNDELMDVMVSLDATPSGELGSDSGTIGSPSERGQTPAPGGSMLEGIGSRLGGWLAGGGSAGSAKGEAAGDRPSQSSTEETDQQQEAPVARPAPESLPPPLPQPPDPLEFGDQEPLERVLIDDSLRELPE